MNAKQIITSFLILFFISAGAKAQIPVISVITTLANKVINAIDLEVEKIQNETIVLQNAQKELENAMSESELGDIAGWVQKQKDLYSEYYQELSQVKQVISDYDKVKDIISIEEKIISQSRNASALFKQDPHFSANEINYMTGVYSGILNESAKNLDQLFLVVNAFITQMSDGARLSIIDNAATGMQKNYNDLRDFNQQNIFLSLQRAGDINDYQSVKKLYGLN